MSALCSHCGQEVPAVAPFMSVPEVARFFAVSDAVVYSMIERNEIPFIRLGTRKGLRIPTVALRKMAQLDGEA
jgi:excisionase family DNA binding protein